MYRTRQTEDAIGALTQLEDLRKQRDRLIEAIERLDGEIAVREHEQNPASIETLRQARGQLQEALYRTAETAEDKEKQISYLRIELQRRYAHEEIAAQKPFPIWVRVTQAVMVALAVLVIYVLTRS